MKRYFPCFASITVAAAFLAATGCNSREPVVPVSGVATYQGEPLVECVILFTPKEPADTDFCFSSVGVTDAQGRFTLATSELKSRPGAVVGKHSVAFRFPQWGTETDEESPEPVVDAPILPPEYTGGTKFLFDVPAGGTDAANFELE